MSSDNGAPTVGFWFQHPPLVDGTHEGICRAFAWILKGLAEKKTSRLVVATPIWAHEMLLGLLRAHEIPLDNIEIIVSRPRLPIFLRIAFHSLAKRMGRSTHVDSWSDRLRTHLVKLTQSRLLKTSLLKLLSTDSLVVVAAVLALSTLGSLLLLPFAALYSACSRVFGKVRAVWHGIDVAGRANRKFGSGYVYLYNRLLDHEYDVLASKAGRNRSVKVWYIAWPWADAAAKLKAPLVVSLWDFVCSDFPTRFHVPMVAESERKFRRLLARADAVATNSEYVRQKHAVSYFRVQRDHTHVVRLAPNDYRSWLTEAQESGDSRKFAAATIREFIHSKKDDAQWNTPGMRNFLQEFPFEETPFLFNSTQIRPHKNTMNMLRAYERLLRRKHVNLKLILTGKPWAFPDTSQFIGNYQLHWDVLPLPHVPDDVHASFYHLAELTVVPTLFEGGFPFPFHESLSVETPVLMGEIPVNAEVIPDHLAKVMLFDPFDADSMAQKILWALSHRDELLQRQLAFHGQTSERTSGHTAAEYGALLERFANA